MSIASSSRHPVASRISNHAMNAPSSTFVSLVIEMNVEIGMTLGMQSERVAVYDGIEPNEVKEILATAFGLADASSVIAFQTQPEGLLIPLSFACQQPSKFSQHSLHLVVKDSSAVSRSDLPSKRIAVVPGTQLISPPQSPENICIAQRDSQARLNDDPLAGFSGLLSSIAGSSSPLLSPAEARVVAALAEVTADELVICFTEFQANNDLLNLVKNLMSLSRRRMEIITTERMLAQSWRLKQAGILPDKICNKLQGFIRARETDTVAAFVAYQLDSNESKLVQFCLEFDKEDCDEDSGIDEELQSYRASVVREAQERGLLSLDEATTAQAIIASASDISSSLVLAFNDVFSAFASNGDLSSCISDIRRIIGCPSIPDDTLQLLENLRTEYGYSSEWLMLLRSLICNGDIAALAALDVFGEDGSWKDLVDTLDCLVSIRKAQFARDQNERSLQHQRHQEVSLPDSIRERRLLRSLVDNVWKENAIDAMEWRGLCKLIEDKDVVLDAAFSVYNEDDSWHEFVDTVKRRSNRQTRMSVERLASVSSPSQC